MDGDAYAKALAILFKELDDYQVLEDEDGQLYIQHEKCGEMKYLYPFVSAEDSYVPSLGKTTVGVEVRTALKHRCGNNGGWKVRDPN